MFTAPPGVDQQPEGLVDENPIVLHGVTKDLFRKFLSLLFPAYDRSIGSPIEINPRASEWINILHLAQRWEFSDIKSVALTNLQNFKLDPVTNVEIADAYNVDDWAREAWEKILGRKKPLSADESVRLGIERATKVAHAREALLTIKWQLQNKRNPKALWERVNEVARNLLHYPEHASLSEDDIVATIMAIAAS